MRGGYEKNFVFFIEQRITYLCLIMIFEKSIIMPMFSIRSCASKRLFTFLVNIAQRTLNIDLKDQFIAHSIHVAYDTSCIHVATENI